MSDRYLVALVVVVALVLVSRYVFTFLPLARWAAPMTVVDAVLFGMGSASLALHCGAMFFPDQVRAVPGGHEVIGVVDPLGTSSILWYAVGATAILAGLRRQHLLVQVAAAAGLAAVGYTMYDGGHLHTHLTAIFSTVVLMALILASLVVPPWRQRRSLGYASTPPQPIA